MIGKFLESVEIVQSKSWQMEGKFMIAPILSPQRMDIYQELDIPIISYGWIMGKLCVVLFPPVLLCKL